MVSGTARPRSRLAGISSAVTGAERDGGDLAELLAAESRVAADTATAAGPSRDQLVRAAEEEVQLSVVPLVASGPLQIAVTCDDL